MFTSIRNLTIMLFVFLTACEGGTFQNMPLENTPESVAVNFVEALYRLEAEKVESLTYAGDFNFLYGNKLECSSRVDPEASKEELKAQNKKMKIRVIGSWQNENGSYTISLEAKDYLSIETFEHKSESTIDVVTRNEDGNWKVFMVSEHHKRPKSKYF